MFKFDENGNLVLPDAVAKRDQEKKERMEKGKCLLVRKEQTNCTSPKKCMLHLKLSEAIGDNRFVATIYNAFNENSQTPMKIVKLNEKEFDIEIGSDFRRCSDCAKLINRFRGFLYGNIIEEKGSCDHEDVFRKHDFCYEDYFE